MILTYKIMVWLKICVSLYSRLTLFKTNNGHQIQIHNTSELQNIGILEEKLLQKGLNIFECFWLTNDLLNYKL